MQKSIKHIILLCIISASSLVSQVIYETDNSHINQFLNRLDQKGLIQIEQSILPYSKFEISLLLNSIKDNTSQKLSVLEKKELKWFIEKYSLENGTEASIPGELNVNEDKLKLRVLPIAGYGISSTGDKTGHTRKIGARLEAYLGDNLGILFEYLDTGEYGGNVDRHKYYSEKTSHWIKDFKENIEFSDVRGQINYSWDWGVISLKKDYNKWGHGKYGQLILANKPASYPHIQLQLNPTKWLSINYIHGWLNSLVIDSSKSFYYGESEVEPRIFEEYKSKFIAANYISIMPNDWLAFSLGNSFVYSGDLRPEMFIPVMYYKVMDHNTGRGDKGDGNGIIYFDLGIKYPENYRFYATAIIDVLNIRDMLEGKWHTQWFGYTVGASVVDLGIKNSEFRIEYTKTNPWVYENKYELTNYKHLNYSLGHWIGQNADLLTTEFNYSFIRGMHISLMWQIFRKGDMKDIYYAYNDPEPLDFLYGDQRIENKLKLSIDYEFMHNIYMQSFFRYSDITDEKIGRTQNFLLGNKYSFSLALSYGLAF